MKLFLVLKIILCLIFYLFYFILLFGSTSDKYNDTSKVNESSLM